jgi:hypothetical protein
MPSSFCMTTQEKVKQRNMWSDSWRTFTTGLILIALLSPSTITGQTQPYTVRTGEYIVDLPSAEWRATVSGARYPRDFRFGKDESFVHLRIRRDIVNENLSTSDVAERQRRFDRSSKPGYITAAIESFNGALSGTKYAYDYVTSGKPMAKVIYYLRATKRTIYRIEFTGSPRLLLDLSDQTQSIARSFRLK